MAIHNGMEQDNELTENIGNDDNSASKDKIHKSFKYRIYPTKEQETLLNEWQRSLRFIWNWSLGRRQVAHSLEGKDAKVKISHFFSKNKKMEFVKDKVIFCDQRDDFRNLKKEIDFLQKVPFTYCDEVLKSLSQSWQRCFKGLAKSPNFKKKHDGISMKLPSSELFSIRDGKLKISGFNTLLSIALHRPLEGRVMSCSITKGSNNTWFASILCELDSPVKIPFSGKIEPGARVIGLDMGVANPIADSNGGFIANPKLFERYQQKTAKLQRKAAKQKKFSQNWKKTQNKIGRLSTKKANIRNDWQHKATSHYVNNFDIIAIEDLDVSDMIKSAAGTIESPGKNVKKKSNLNRSISDVGWYSFGMKLAYKITRKPIQGCLVKVPPAYTSQKCSNCGHIDPLNRLTQDKFACVKCNTRMHADLNAAINIKSQGIDQINNPPAPKPKSIPLSDRKKKTPIKKIEDKT